MPSVSCPSCSTSQPIEASASSYVCTSCGKPWDLVACSSCGSRFHAKPGTTGWTCPTCGTPHGTAAPSASAAGGTAAVSVSGDDLDTASSEPLGGRQQPFGSEEPTSPFPMPRRDRPSRFPPWGYAVIGVLVVAVIALFLLTRGGDDDPGERSSPSPNAAEAVAAMCTDVQQLTQLVRDDALGRSQDALKDHVGTLRDAGDQKTAKQVRTLIAKIGDLRTALQTQPETQRAAAAAVQRAVRALPC